MKNVIVLGSLNMDLSISCDRIPIEGETLNGYDFFINPGGKGGNQAVACAKLDAPTYMIANVGNDIFGKQLIETLQQYNVLTTYVNQEESISSGIAMVICNNGDNRIILGNGANHTLETQRVKASLDELASDQDIFLTQLENKYETVKESIAYAKKKGMYTILNPAPARMLEDCIYENLDVIIVNQSECELLSGIYPNTVDECNQALDFFAQKQVQAIITLGSKGSVTRENGKLIEIASRRVHAIDTTAAGDSYIGALCAELANGKDMEESLFFASDVAALCVTRRGAQVAIPYRQEVYDFYQSEEK